MTTTKLCNPRRSEIRKIKPAILVVGDGESEKKYFEEFRRMGPIVRIITRDTNETGIDKTLVKARGYVKDNHLDLKGDDKVVIVTDLDYRYDERGVEDMVRKCDAEGFGLYLSNPCFEVWLILHYQLLTRPWTPDELNEQLGHMIGHKYDKSRGIPWDRAMQDTAVKNAKTILRANDCTALSCYRKEPSTMVYRLVECINKGGDC